MSGLWQDANFANRPIVYIRHIRPAVGLLTNGLSNKLVGLPASFDLSRGTWTGHSMFLLTAIAITVQLSQHPLGLVRPGEEALYDAFIQAEAISMTRILAGKTCDQFRMTSYSTKPLNGGSAVPMAHEKVFLEGCGIRHTQNLEVARFGAEAKWDTRTRAPGDTYTNHDMQEDFIPTMFGVAKLRAAGTCTDNFVQDTYVAATFGNVSFPDQQYQAAHPDQPSVTSSSPVDDADAILRDSWAEVWKLRACGEDRVFMIIFVPTTSQQIRPSYVDITEMPASDLPKRVQTR